MEDNQPPPGNEDAQPGKNNAANDDNDDKGDDDDDDDDDDADNRGGSRIRVAGQKRTKDERLEDAEPTEPTSEHATKRPRVEENHFPAPNPCRPCLQHVKPCIVKATGVACNACHAKKIKCNLSTVARGRPKTSTVRPLHFSLPITRAEYLAEDRE
jgi:hypothetical protein